MTIAANSPASIFRPFAVLAASAFTVGFIGVMALNSASLFAQMGVPAPASAGLASTGPALQAVASPASSGAASEAWNFPKSI